MAIYYVKSSGGSDSNDGLSVANAFATIQHGMDQWSSAQNPYELRIVNDGTHSITSTLVYDHSATGSRPFQMYGADSSGNLYDDNSAMVTIDGSGLSNTDPMFKTTGSGMTQYRNLRFTGGPGYAVMGLSTVTMQWTFCRFDNCQYGIGNNFADDLSSNGTSYQPYNFMRECEIDNHTSHGTNYPGTNRGPFYMYGCKIHSNGGDGFKYRSDVQCYHCLIYNNTGKGVGAYSSALTLSRFINNTVYNNGEDGVVQYANYDHQSLSGNNIANNGGYGYKTNNTGNGGNQRYMTHNIFHSNTSGAHNFDGGSNSMTYIGQSNQNVDPDFLSTTTSSDDFLRPSKTSPARLASPLGIDIGALRAEEIGFTVTNSGFLSLGTGDVGDTVVVSGRSFQKISDSPIVWRRV